MDTIVSKKDLVDALSRIVPVAERKSTMPVLATVLLDASGARVRIAATDLRMSIRGSVEAETKTAGVAAVLGKDLLERVRLMPEGPIHLSAKGSAFTMRAAGVSRRYTLRSMTGGDFPPIPAAPEGGLTLPSATLAGLLSRTSYAISTDKTRAHLNSLLLESGDGVLRAVSTDGHRLSLCEAAADGMPAGEWLIPLGAVKQVARMCEGESVTVAFGGPDVHFLADGYVLTTRLVDATFPPWRQVVPKSKARTVRVVREQLVDALHAVSLAASDRTSGIKLEIGKKALRVTAESGDKGDAFDEMAAELDGSPLSIGVNAHYMLDALAAVGGEDVTIELGGDLDPIAMRADGFVAVVMPMRI